MREREPVSKGKNFGVGDLVRLKSGRPSMPIERSGIRQDRFGFRHVLCQVCMVFE
jgi:uncharacterized protein YodC (DUF2158 family)